MAYTFGFIGTGNMGGALAKAAASALKPQELFLSDRAMEKAEALAKTLGCAATIPEKIAENCQFIFLGVKPQMMQDLLQSLAPVLQQRKDRFVFISMAAGVSMADIQRMAGDSYPVIRIMPNTPVAVGEGVVLYDATENVAQEELDAFCHCLSAGGRLDRLNEKLIDAGSALSGCGPAFACLFLEALADGAVACGLPRKQAQEYAAQMLLGTAKLVLETGEHPGALKDAVCSPGGSTIVGVRVLEESSFRSAAMEAVAAAFERTKELGK